MLYHIDYLGSMVEVPFTAQGYAGHFLFGTLDKYWKPGMNLEEGKAVLARCLHELKTRFLLQPTEFCCKCASVEGISTWIEAAQ
jgi:20S proteasome subunit beta 4